MRSLWTIAPLLVVAGCHNADQPARLANAMADAADRKADTLDPAENAVDAAAWPAENLVGRIANVAVPAGSSFVTDGWVGRWTGVEGTMLDIARDSARGLGHYRLTMRYSLDDKGVFKGVADGEAIRFARPDGDHELYAATGDEIGLKWLAGRKHCLMVQPGEGYCRGGPAAPSGGDNAQE